MRKVRSIINIILGAIVVALGFNACDRQYIVVEKYGIPIEDTTAHCMYGVNPIVEEENQVNDQN